MKYRNGVSLGAKGSLKNMLMKSFGSNSFSKFWNYWNPIWGYFLNKYIYKTVNRIFPRSISVIITFFVSGLLHDLIVTIIYNEIVFTITPWFTLIGCTVILSKNIIIKSEMFLLRALVNFVYLSIPLAVVHILKGLYV